MPKLTSLLTPDNDGDGDDYSSWQPPRYGYGTEINLTEEQCEALGLTGAKSMDAGQPVKISATGLVTRSSSSISAEGKGVCLSIQLTAISLDKDGSASAARAASVLYGAGDDTDS